MADTTAAVLAYDRAKYLAAMLIKRSRLKLVAASLCDNNKMDDGAGLTAYFVRYNRMNTPLDTLTEGTPPTPDAPNLSQYTVTLDQWGALIKITDIAEITTKHPVVQEAMKLLADNAARVIDREIQLVWLANTNVQYYDGSSSYTNRASLTGALYLTDAVIHKAVSGMVDNGVSGRDGPVQEDAKEASAQGTVMNGSHFVGICGPQVMRDVMVASTSLGTWVSVKMYNDPKSIYSGELGTWLGVRWVETNFIPKFTRFGSTAAGTITTGHDLDGGASLGVATNTPFIQTANTGGSLTGSTAYYFKVTRKSKLRGFEEDISYEYNMTSAAGGSGSAASYTFDFTNCSTSYRYYIYFGSATGDSNLKQVSSSGHEAGVSVTVTAVPASTVTPPPSVNASGPTVHPVFILGAEACIKVTLRNLEMKSVTAPDSANPLLQYKLFGYKFLQKALVPDSNRLLRIEVLSRN